MPNHLAVMFSKNDFTTVIFTVKMTVVFTRHYQLPSRTFFLLGPRGTGKTTWLKQELPQAKWFNLLLTSEFLRLAQDPNLFRKEVEAIQSPAWIIVDEVQRLPSLLNEVHALIADYGKKYRFALTGSSARKLKRSDANLLAGRAIQRQFFPLRGVELEYQFTIEDVLQSGTLPSIRQDKSEGIPQQEINQVLEAYVDTYLRQEIKEEALVKKLEPFARFLEVVALTNAQLVNIANIARDSGVSRATAQGYFDVLTDTLIGSFLPAWKPRARIKETGHPKFYLFDPGVARTLAGRLRYPLEAEEKGHLFETLVFNELRAWSQVHDVGAKFSFWRTESQSEVDFIIQIGKETVAVEVKSTPHWKAKDSASLKTLLEQELVHRAYGVYLGKNSLKDDQISVLPFVEFLQLLESGRL